MHASHKKPLLRAVYAVLVLQALLIPAAAADEATPLIDKVRNATAQYLDIKNALKQGWVPATPCVSGEDTGAMGVHFILPAVGLRAATPTGTRGLPASTSQIELRNESEIRIAITYLPGPGECDPGGPQIREREKGSPTKRR